MLFQDGRGPQRGQPDPFRVDSNHRSPMIIEADAQWAGLRQNSDDTQELALQARDYIRRLMGSSQR